MEDRVTHMIGVPEAREKGAEYFPKKEQLKTALTWGKETDIQVQEAQRDPKRLTPQHILKIKRESSKEQERGTWCLSRLSV